MNISVIRRIDSLGRIAIPSEILRKYNLTKDSPVEFCLDSCGITLIPHVVDKNNFAQKWLTENKTLTQSDRAEFQIKDNKTVICEIIRDNKRITGMAVCNEHDTFNPLIGMVIAYCRAANYLIPPVLLA